MPMSLEVGGDGILHRQYADCTMPRVMIHEVSLCRFPESLYFDSGLSS